MPFRRGDLARVRFDALDVVGQDLEPGTYVQLVHESVSGRWFVQDLSRSSGTVEVVEDDLEAVT